MGGLIVKKACILGRNDPQYKDVIVSTRAIVFLSTPHRGSDLSAILNCIVAVLMVEHSPKNYVADLNRNSAALQDINDQFMFLAPTMQLFSLYETQPAAIGLRRVMVVEKHSSILGYLNEISKPLDADHHNVCKFTSPQDPNYISMRNILKPLLGHFEAQITRNAWSPLATRQQPIAKISVRIISCHALG